MKRLISGARALAGGTMLAVGAMLLSLASAPGAGASSGALGETLFINECGMCHVAGGTGTVMLEQRHGSSKALLAERTDLQPGFIELVVRNGLNAMPAMTRVEVTDEELTSITRYLTRERNQR